MKISRLQFKTRPRVTPMKESKDKKIYKRKKKYLNGKTLDVDGCVDGYLQTLMVVAWLGLLGFGWREEGEEGCDVMSGW